MSSKTKFSPEDIERMTKAIDAGSDALNKLSTELIKLSIQWNTLRTLLDEAHQETLFTNNSEGH